MTILAQVRNSGKLGTPECAPCRHNARAESTSMRVFQKLARHEFQELVLPARTVPAGGNPVPLATRIYACPRHVCSPNAVFKMTWRFFCPTPGSRSSSSTRRGTLPGMAFDQQPARRDDSSWPCCVQSDRLDVRAGHRLPMPAAPRAYGARNNGVVALFTSCPWLAGQDHRHPKFEARVVDQFRCAAPDWRRAAARKSRAFRVVHDGLAGRGAHLLCVDSRCRSVFYRQTRVVRVVPRRLSAG